jgi:hypothetical protein
MHECWKELERTDRTVHTGGPVSELSIRGVQSPSEGICYFRALSLLVVTDPTCSHHKREWIMHFDQPLTSIPDENGLGKGRWHSGG